MTIHMRRYAGVADIEPIITLKQVCTTAQNMYDAPTISELRVLLAPLSPEPTTVSPPWEDEQGTVKRHLYRQAMTQQATMLWEEADRSEEHTSELQSPCNLVCRLLLEKKKKIKITIYNTLSH